MFPVKLRVTDDVGNHATSVQEIRITNPPHPPVARTPAVYLVSLCESDTLTLDGSGSFDPDDGLHEAGCPTCPEDGIQAWNWDLDGAPWTYEHGSGKYLDLGTGFRQYFNTPKSYAVALRVTDRTATSFPDSGQADLTHQAFAEVRVYDNCLCDLQATPSCGEVDLSWSDVGAEKYLVLRSLISPSMGFESVGETTEAHLVVPELAVGKTYYFRVQAILAGQAKCLSKALPVYTDPELCRPIADAGGPYVGTVAAPVQLDGSGSMARLGSIVTWEWDLNGDGEFGDAKGVKPPFVWNSPGTYRIALKVKCSEPLVPEDISYATVEITYSDCIRELFARAKGTKVQLVWDPVPGAAAYHVYRSTTPNFVGNDQNRIAANHGSDYATYLDEKVTPGVTYFYKVVKVVSKREVCESNEAAVTPKERGAGNTAPAANAGPDLRSDLGAVVQLNGIASYDAERDPLTFQWSFASRPTGSSAVLSGAANARPTFTPDVKGSYVVKLVVRDAQFASAPDTLVVTTRNKEPEASAGPDLTGRVGGVIQLDGLRSMDLDGDALTYRWYFLRRPATSAAKLLNATSAKPTFTTDAYGQYEVALVVNDGMFDSPVDSCVVNTLNTLPIANAGDDRTVAVGRRESLDGSASSDADHQPLSFLWAIKSQPLGSTAALEDGQSVTPELVPDLPGDYILELVVNDGLASSQPDEVTLTAKAPPKADAGVDQIVALGATVQLTGNGSTDPANQPLIYHWAFDSKPASSPAALSDADAQNPTFVANAAGTYVLQLVVNDGISDSDPDKVTIITANTPPVANAGPDKEVGVGSLVQLLGAGSSDPDGDPLTYAWVFLSKPTGSTATLDDATAANPRFTADLRGSYALQLTVNDGQVDSAPDQVLLVTANTAPVAEAGPGQTQYAGSTIQLNGTASHDDDSDTLVFSWSFASLPTASQAKLTGAGSAAPTFTADLPGAYLVQLVVNDGKVDSAPDFVTVTAKPFATVPNVLGMVQADAETAIQSANLGVGGVSRLRSPTVPAGQVMNQVPDGGTKVDVGTSVTFSLSTGPDTQAPVVAVVAQPSHVQVGQSVTLTVSAQDDGLVKSLTLTVNGFPLTLVAGKATIQTTGIGGYTALATATDEAGNVGTGQTTFFAIDPSDTTPPTASVTPFPGDGIITVPTEIRGTASDPDGQFASYTLEYVPAAFVDNNMNSDHYVEFYRSETEVANGVLGVIDPTLLQNDGYFLRLTVWDENGNGQHEYLPFSVNGNLKLGNFRLEFTDLTVPVAGMPITITRVYDTLQSKDKGDFGYGWSLGLRDAKIREVLYPHAAGPTMAPGSRVYINTPDGRRVGFTAYTRGNGGFLFPYLVDIALRPDPGVFEQLDFTGHAAGGLNGWFLGGYYFDGLGDDPFNPSAYTLTMKDGTVYEYDQAEGLKKVTDPNTNRLVFTHDGIFHYSAGATDPDQSVPFERDAADRIVKITDPAGNQLDYTYDVAGDLRSFADQVQNVTQYSYHPQRAHYLDTIVDPLGRTAVRTEYDSQGRIVAIIDALGHRVEQSFDLDLLQGTFTDANGHVTQEYFDARGNKVKTVDPVGGVTEFAFDGNNNETSRKDPRGNVSQKEYDSRGNVTKITDALGNVTSLTYNDRSKPTALTDALGHTTQFTYNGEGHLLGVLNALGGQATFTRDAQGRVTSVTDFNGHSTTYDYAGGCSCGKPGKVINPDGTSRSYAYNGFGQTISEVDELGHTTTSTYDGAGRLLAVRDAAGNTTQYTYAGALKISETDPLGRTTLYGYDDANRQIAITNASGGVVRFAYDGGTNRTAVIDPVGNVTRFIYDQAGRLEQQIDPRGNVSQFAHDGAGNRTEAIDRNGRRRTFEYDALNRRTKELWWEGETLVRTINFAFSALGVMTGASDPASSLTFEFDALNRLAMARQTGVPNLADFTLTYAYDGMTNIVSVTDNWDVTVGSNYDARNRLARRVWLGGGLPGASAEFEYDARGNRTKVLRFADTAGTQLVGESGYEFNALGAITDIVHRNGGGAALAQYHYQRDAGQQITQRLLNGQTTDYGYDATGQLVSALYSAGQANEDYSYDANGNRIGGGYAVATGNQLVADGEFAYGYDAEGSLIARTNVTTGATTAYSYDHRNRLVSVVDKDANGNVTQSLALAYDPIDRRIAKQVNGITTRFLHQQEDVWADVDMLGTITARYLLGNRIDEMLARYWETRGTDWYLTDNLGTVRDIANSAGAVANHINYDSFGRILAQSAPAVGDRFVFTGREWDRESGFLFYRARYYSMALGRFIAADPTGFGGGDFNLYRYAANSPTGASDPHGTFSTLQYAIMVDLTIGMLTWEYWAVRRALKGDSIGTTLKCATYAAVSAMLPGLGPLIIDIIADLFEGC